MEHIAFHNCSGEDQISHHYLILLDQRYKKHLNNVDCEVIHCTSVTGENEKVGTLKNQLLTIVKSIVK